MSKDGKPDTWMPLVIGDYLKDTARLTTEQHGAYLLLIMDYWVNGAPPDDDAQLAAITGLDARAWRKNRPALQRFFRVEEGFWRHKRIERELEDWAERKRKFAERAAAGGRAKAAKSTASSTPKAVLTGVLKSCTPSASSEVGATTCAPTLRGQDLNLDLKEGADRPSPSPADDERSWAIDAKRAEEDLLRCRRSDPDLASELEEFISTAKDRIAALRRARLSVVAA